MRRRRPDPRWRRRYVFNFSFRGCRGVSYAVFRFDRQATDAAYVIDAISASGDACVGTNTKDQRSIYNSKISHRDKENCAVRGSAGKENMRADRNAFRASRYGRSAATDGFCRRRGKPGHDRAR